MIGHKENKPVAIAEANVNSKSVGLISSIGVLKGERQQGIGRAIMDACIHYVFAHKGFYAGLFSYTTAEYFYKKIGFVPARHLDVLIIKGDVSGKLP